jgi:Zn-dependent protease
MIDLMTKNPTLATLNNLASLGMNINASLALFNLIPFGVFDGAKIIKWSRTIWGVSVLAAGILYLI